MNNLRGIELRYLLTMHLFAVGSLAGKSVRVLRVEANCSETGIFNESTRISSGRG